MTESIGPEEIGIDLAEALWRLDRLPVQFVDDVATTAMVEGHLARILEGPL